MVPLHSGTMKSCVEAPEPQVKKAVHVPEWCAQEFPPRTVPGFRNPLLTSTNIKVLKARSSTPYSLLKNILLNKGDS